MLEVFHIYSLFGQKQCDMLLSVFEKMLCFCAEILRYSQ